MSHNIQHVATLCNRVKSGRLTNCEISRIFNILSGRSDCFVFIGRALTLRNTGFLWVLLRVQLTLECKVKPGTIVNVMQGKFYVNFLLKELLLKKRVH